MRTWHSGALTVASGTNSGTSSPARIRALAAQRSGSQPGGGSASDPDRAWAEIRENSGRLQQHIALEVRRRAEGQKALQQLVEARAKELAQGIERQVQERMLALHRNVDGLTKRVDVLNKELAVEREKNVRLTQELKFQATQGLSEVKTALERERSQRTEKESLLTRKLSEDVFRLQERLDVEHHAREAMVAGVREEIGAVAKQRHKSDEALVQRLLEDIHTVRQQMGIEREEREKGEEHLATALNEVVQQVRSSIASVA